MISRLRSNNNLFDLPQLVEKRKQGHPKTFAANLGTTSTLAVAQREQAQEYMVNLYSKKRKVLAYDRVEMVKTLKRQVRVVWVYRRTQWVALSVAEIIEYYGARWKIEACFK